MGGSSKKESERADDIARQERERAAQQAAALQAQQAEADAQLQARVGAVTAPTGIEAQTQAQLSPLQTDVEALLRGTAGGAAPVGTPLALAIQERLQADLGRQPEDVFGQNLELLRGQVGQFAARRGIVGSGLELEQLGRTGVELAIRQAQAREQLRADQLNRAITGQQSLETIGAQRRGELTGYLRDLQALEDARRARQIGAVSGGAQYGAQIRSQGNLTALERLSEGEGRALDIESTQLSADREARAAQQRAIGQLAGTAAGAATMFIPGVGPVLAPMVQSGVSGAFGGGQQAGGQNPLALLSQFPTSAGPSSGAQLRSQQRSPSRLSGGYDEFYQRFV